MRRPRGVWTLVAALVASSATAAAMALTPAASSGHLGGDDVFCSRTQVQETSVRQQFLDTGQVMVSTHVLTSLRVGETVCISATLPDPPPMPPSTERPQTGEPGSHADLSEPNETTLLDMIHEEDGEVDADTPDNMDTGQSTEASSSEGNALGEGSRNRIRGVFSHSVVKPRTLSVRSDLGNDEADSDRRQADSGVEGRSQTDGAIGGRTRADEDSGDWRQTGSNTGAGRQTEGESGSWGEADWTAGDWRQADGDSGAGRQTEGESGSWREADWSARDWRQVDGDSGAWGQATLVTGDRRQKRAARLPVTTDDSEAGLGRLLLPPDLAYTGPGPVSSAAADVSPARLRIQLTLLAIQHRHAITSAYTFCEPRIGVTCTCACASFHTCSSCGELCVSKASSSPAADCEGSFLGSARTCCQLKLHPGQQFRAVRLGRAAVFLKLRVSVTELGGGREPVTERQTVEVMMGDDTRLDMNATRLRLSTQTQGGSGAPPGWYVLHEGQVYRPQQINELNEWNLGKLGWLKRRGDEYVTPSSSRLAAAVDVTTVSCTEQQFQVRGDVLLESTVPQLGPPLPEVRVVDQSASHLRLLPFSPGRPVWLGLHLQHLQRLHYLVHRAQLADFDGALHVDATSAVLAELRLWNASGVQHGSLAVSYGASGPPAAQYRFSLVAEKRLRLRLPVALGGEQSSARVCLRPEGSAAPPLCRDLPITRQPVLRLRDDDESSGKQLVVNGESNPTNTVERFLRALNPATWLQSGGSWTTAVGVAIDVIILVVVVSVVWKCFRCCRACCCRRSKSDV